MTALIVTPGPEHTPRTTASPPSDRIRISDRLEFEPIAVRFALDIVGRQTAATRNVQFRRAAFEYLLPVSSELDVLWGRDALFFLTKAGDAKEIAVDEVATISAAVDDGEHLFVAADGRLLILDHHGRVVTRVDKTSGLPSFAYGCVQLQLIEPGVLLIAAEHDRSYATAGTWLGRVDVRAGRARVTTLIDANQPIDESKGEFRELIARVDVPFRCDWPMVDFTGNDGRRFVYVSRFTVPLVLNVADWTVRPFPAKDAFEANFPVFRVYRDGFDSDRGTLYVADDEDDYRAFTRDPATGRFAELRPTTNRSHGGGRASACLLIYDSWLYYLGVNRWFRERLDTGTRETLSQNRAPFHLGLYGPWRLVHSRQFGLVATDERQICRLIIDGKPVP